jgi:hypothetical protein
VGCNGVVVDWGPVGGFGGFVGFRFQRDCRFDIVEVRNVGLFGEWIYFGLLVFFFWRFFFVSWEMKKIKKWG